MALLREGAAGGACPPSLGVQPNRGVQGGEPACRAVVPGWPWGGRERRPGLRKTRLLCQIREMARLWLSDPGRGLGPAVWDGVACHQAGRQGSLQAVALAWR